jgi:hypothetical protein
MDRKMSWPRWYSNRREIITVLVGLFVVGLFALVVVLFPHFNQATGFGPEWECKNMAQGDPVCVKKLGR